MQMGAILQDNILQNVTIIGSGLMGHGIALKFAQHGFSVNVYDPNNNSLSTLLDRVKTSPVSYTHLTLPTTPYV